MEVITSATNGIVKLINKLKLKKYRDEMGLYITEGYKNVLDTAKVAPKSVNCVVLGESAYKQRGDMFSEFKHVVISDVLFDKISETKSEQGILGINVIPPSCVPISNRCILLDRVRDPGNVGTVLRTAVACGYDVIANGCADIYSPKTVRSAMSAVAKCRVGIDIPVCEIKNAGYELIVADMSGESVFSAVGAKKYCIVIGNEAEGVHRSIIEQADRLLSIPQENIESLNAAVAGAVMMFALRYIAGVDK